MPNPPTIINGQLIFVGALAGQVAVQAQPIAGNNLIFNLPNTVPNPNAVLSVIAVNGSTVTFGFAPPAPQSFNFSQITGTIATSQLGSVEGNGSKVQLTTGAAVSPVTSKLGAAAEYAILAYSGITNTGASVITGGNIGSAPTPGPQAGFTFTSPAAIDNANAGAARTAGNAAFTYYSALTPTQTGLADLSTNNGGGGAGVYHAGVFSGGALDIPTSITLDAQGNAGALFVFIAASTTILESGASIILANGAQAANVVWVVGSSFTQIGNNNTMVGTILAYTSITLDGGTLNGRALAVGGGNGAVTIAAAEAITASLGTGSVVPGDVLIYDIYGNAVDSGILLSSLGGAAGVTSFNSRSGAVSPLAGDYAGFYLPIATQLPITIAAVSHKFLTSYTSSTGVFTAAQPAYTDISGTPSVSGTTSIVASANANVASAAIGVVLTADGTGNVDASSGVLLTNLATHAFVTSQGYITSSALTPYALLAGATFTGTVSITGASLVLNGVTISQTAPTSGQVLTASSSSAAAWATPAGGSVSFDQVTTGLNNGGNTLTVGNSSTLTFTGSGVINASELGGVSASGYALLTGATFSGAVQATTVYATVALEVFAALKDGSASSGTSGQLLSSTGGSVAWINQSALSIAYSQVTGTPSLAGYALLSGAVFSGTIQTNGALNDGAGSPGVSGYILTSTGTSTLWKINPSPVLSDIAGNPPSAGDNHIASGTGTLAAGTFTVTLTGSAAFADTNYVVQLSYSGAPTGTGKIYSTIVSGSSFTVNSTVGGDTDAISWTAIGF